MSKTSKIPIKLWHSAITTTCSMVIQVFSIMILTIQPQKVLEISEAVMRMMGLDLVEKATLTRNHRQRGLKGNFLTSLPVSHHLSSYYYKSCIIFFPGHTSSFFFNFNFKTLCCHSYLNCLKLKNNTNFFLLSCWCTFI